MGRVWADGLGGVLLHELPWQKQCEGLGIQLPCLTTVLLAEFNNKKSTLGFSSKCRYCVIEWNKTRYTAHQVHKWPWWLSLQMLTILPCINVQVVVLPILVQGCTAKNTFSFPTEQSELCTLAGAICGREGLSQIALDWWRVCLSSKNWNATFRWVWSPDPQRRDLGKHLRGSSLNQTIPEEEIPFKFFL